MRKNINEEMPNVFQYGEVPTSWTVWGPKCECLLYINSRPIHDNVSFLCEKIFDQIQIPSFLSNDENQEVDIPPAIIKHSEFLVGYKEYGIDFHRNQDGINLLFHGKKQWFMKVPVKSADKEESDFPITSNQPLDLNIRSELLGHANLCDRPDSRPIHDNVSFACEKMFSQIQIRSFLSNDESQEVDIPPAVITHSGFLVGYKEYGIEFHRHQDGWHKFVISWKEAVVSGSTRKKRP